MIVPTIGRIVYYFNSVGTKPEPAMVFDVLDDRKISVNVLGPNNRCLFEVPLVQEEDSETHTSNFCEWMPYQTKAAVKYPV